MLHTHQSVLTSFESEAYDWGVSEKVCEEREVECTEVEENDTEEEALMRELEEEEQARLAQEAEEEEALLAELEAEEMDSEGVIEMDEEPREGSHFENEIQFETGSDVGESAREEDIPQKKKGYSFSYVAKVDD